MNRCTYTVVDDSTETTITRDVEPGSLRGGVLMNRRTNRTYNLLWAIHGETIANDVIPKTPPKELFRLAAKTLCCHPIVIPFLFGQTIWRVKDDETRALSSMENSDDAAAVYLEGEPLVFAFQIEPGGIFLNIAVKAEIGCIDWDHDADDVLYIRKDGSFTTDPHQCPFVHFKDEKKST